MHDGNKVRYGGKGVLKAFENVEKVIAPALMGMHAHEQSRIVRKVIELDGTENKSKLGANTFLRG